MCSRVLWDPWLSWFVLVSDRVDTGTYGRPLWHTSQEDITCQWNRSWSRLWVTQTWSNRFFNTLRPRHNGCHFTDAIFKCIFLNENFWIPIKISLKFVPKGPINYIPTLVQIMAWRRQGDKPLSETMMVRLLTPICITRPQWVNTQSARE